MNPFYEEYLEYCQLPSDINEHLSLLYKLAAEVRHTTEFGVGYGRSTRAFIAALHLTGGTHHSYEIKVLSGVEDLFKRAWDAKLDATLHIQSTLEANIEETDMLLVDSHHVYSQVKGELERSGDKVRKYICFHDTVTFGLSGQDSGSVGILPAINGWMDNHPEWKFKEQRDNNNGFWVLERAN